MNGLKFVVVSILVGVVVTLLTGYVNSTPSQLLGATWYGFPATWLRYLVVGPQYNPWVVSILGLVVDVVLWSVVAALVLRGLMNCMPARSSPAAHRGRSRRSK